MNKQLLFFMLFALVVSIGTAQAQTVTGKVIDSESGESLPGVTILLKGTTTGTFTDVNGNYSLSTSSGDDVLVISFVGYTSQEITVGSQSTINVSLVSDVSELEELVVIGYGESSIKDATGRSSSYKN